LRPPFDLHLRKRGRWPWVAVTASVLAHSLLLFGWITGRLPEVPRLPRQLIVLAPPAGGPNERITPYQLPRQLGDQGINRLPQPRRGSPAQQRPRPELPRREEAVTVLPQPEPRVPVSIGEPGAPPAGVGRIGPGLADGHLWVRPLPLPPRELAERLAPQRAELLDSMVSVIVQAYLDSIAEDPSGWNVGSPPSWTTEVAGKKFGLDSKHIYVAGLKIPAAVLALLPISGGNIDQNRAYSHLMDLRADLLYAGRRAETLDEFKEVIREIRRRKEREREMARNQRTAPPPETPATP
jgi:hypothetical protein